jgi:glycosyltransferase involved in cell wall biosynthesis
VSDATRPGGTSESRAPTGGKVLLLSGLQLYPTLSGGTLRSHSLALALKRHGYDVFVHSLTGRKPDYRARQPSAVQRWPGGVDEYVDRSLPSVGRWLASYVLGLPPLWLTARLATGVRSPGELLLPRLLRRKLAWCDVVVADFPFVYPILLARSARGRLRIVNTHNIEHHLYDDPTRWRDRRIRAAVRAVELKAAASCDILVSCCDGDADFFTANVPVRRSVVVPNGVDVRRFEGIAAHRPATRKEQGLADDIKVFLFTASRWGPNREAFDYLREFARTHARFLEDRKVHILVAGNVTAQPERLPGFTATGRVTATEPYFAAADAALNPIASGTGTNLKTCEFLAARLPLLSTTFGARGFHLEHGRTGFLFDKKDLASALSAVRSLFDEHPARLREMTDAAYAANERLIDMDLGVGVLVDAIGESLKPTRSREKTT